LFAFYFGGIHPGFYVFYGNPDSCSGCCIQTGCKPMAFNASKIAFSKHLKRPHRSSKVAEGYKKKLFSSGYFCYFGNANTRKTNG
jgi:hypothetical protein